MKPGIRTSEFWAMVVQQLLGIGVLTGVIKPDFPQADLVAMITSGFVVGAYIYSRAKVKTAVPS